MQVRIFTPLETKGRRKRDMVSLTGFTYPFILSRPKTLPFRARMDNGRSSIPPRGTSDFSPGGSIILIFILFLGCKISFAQDVPLILRESLIFTTLNNIEKMQDSNRERAIRETMQEAQMRLMEPKYVPKRVKEKSKAEGFRLKDLVSRAHPYLNAQTKFFDNVDTGSELRKSSIAHTFTPGLKINFLGSRGKSITLNTYIQNLYYNNRSRSNTQSAELDLLGTFNIGRYTLSVSNDYFTNHIAKSELVTHDESDYYWRDALNFNLGRHFNRIGFDMGYGVEDYEYQSTADSLASDRIVQTFNFKQFLRIATRTLLQFEYDYDRTGYSYTPSSDSNIYNYSLGLSAVLSHKLAGSMKMAYSLGDYKAGDDYTKTTFTGELGYNVSRRTNYSLGFDHIINESATDSGYYIEDDFSLTCNHRLGFNPKYLLSFGGEVSLRGYPKNTTSSEVDTYTFGSGLSYAFKRWLDFSLNYDYIKKSSKGASYYSNSILFKTQMRF